MVNYKIAVLGGSGKAGRPLVEQMIKAGYQVRLLLRYPEKFDLVNQQIEILQGDARDKACLTELVQGCGAMISTLGHPKGESVPIMSTVTKSLINVLLTAKIKRYVVVSGLFDTGSEKHDEYTKQAAEYMQQHYPKIMDDRRLEFRLLAESELDWTYVRVPYIVQDHLTGNIAVNVDYLPGQKITATDLAQFLINQLENSQYVRLAPFVASIGNEVS